MILAAGLGTRMRPLTLDRAKPVLPVLDRPLLHWTLEMLAGHGVKDVMINLHYRARRRGRRPGLRRPRVVFVRARDPRHRRRPAEGPPLDRRRDPSHPERRR